MPTERFQFTGEGGHQLSAALELPDGEPGAFALFAHCFTCGKDTLAAKRISVALAAKGIAVLRFDFTGLGSSEGILPIRRFPPTLPISCAPPIICVASARRRRF